ncbi:MAG: hypothetical protein MJ093_07515 [Saccharofermentans sp.]|nr:hypothetical protein [Saccharofermentans sp.]
MKKQKIIALLTISSICLTSMAGCSSEKESTETTAGSTAATTTAEQVEETTLETTVKETEAPLPYVELQDFYLSDTTTDYVPGTDSFTCTNVYIVGVRYSWTDDSDASEIRTEVIRNGEFISEDGGGMYGYEIGPNCGDELNEQGYLLPATYDISVYNRNELVFSYTINIEFDEATAPERSFIMRGYMDGYFTVDRYSEGDYGYDHAIYDDYTAGCSGFYLASMYPGCNSEEGTYVGKWTYNGDAMPDVEYSYNESTEGNRPYEGKFAFEMPDGSSMPAGEYELNLYYNGELFCTCQLNLK